MHRQRLDVGFAVKSISDAGEFSGYGSVFDVKDSYGDMIIPGAFANSLSAWKSKGRLPAMLWQHNPADPIGVYTLMEEDEKGLYVEGRLLKDDDDTARKAYAHLKAGSISGLSIGFNYVSGGIAYDSDQDAYIIKQVDLWEVSLVTFPANDEARIQSLKNSIASGEMPDAKIVERILRDAGMSRRQAKAIMARGYSGIGERDARDTAEVDRLNSLISAIKR